MMLDSTVAQGVQKSLVMAVAIAVGHDHELS